MKTFVNKYFHFYLCTRALCPLKDRTIILCSFSISTDMIVCAFYLFHDIINALRLKQEIYFFIKLKELQSKLIYVHTEHLLSMNPCIKNDMKYLLNGFYQLLNKLNRVLSITLSACIEYTSCQLHTICNAMICKIYVFCLKIESNRLLFIHFDLSLIIS